MPNSPIMTSSLTVKNWAINLQGSWGWLVGLVTFIWLNSSIAVKTCLSLVESSFNPSLPYVFVSGAVLYILGIVLLDRFLPERLYAISIAICTSVTFLLHISTEFLSLNSHLLGFLFANLMLMTSWIHVSLYRMAQQHRSPLVLPFVLLSLAYFPNDMHSNICDFLGKGGRVSICCLLSIFICILVLLLHHWKDSKLYSSISSSYIILSRKITYRRDGISELIRWIMLFCFLASYYFCTLSHPLPNSHVDTHDEERSSLHLAFDPQHYFVLDSTLILVFFAAFKRFQKYKEFLLFSLSIVVPSTCTYLLATVLPMYQASMQIVLALESLSRTSIILFCSFFISLLHEKRTLLRFQQRESSQDEEKYLELTSISFPPRSSCFPAPLPGLLVLYKVVSLLSSASAPLHQASKLSTEFHNALYKIQPFAFAFAYADPSENRFMSRPNASSTSIRGQTSSSIEQDEQEYIWLLILLSAVALIAVISYVYLLYFNKVDVHTDSSIIQSALSYCMCEVDEVSPTSLKGGALVLQQESAGVDDAESSTLDLDAMRSAQGRETYASDNDGWSLEHSQATARKRQGSHEYCINVDTFGSSSDDEHSENACKGTNRTSSTVFGTLQQAFSGNGSATQLSSLSDPFRQLNNHSESNEGENGNLHLHPAIGTGVISLSKPGACTVANHLPNYERRPCDTTIAIDGSAYYQIQDEDIGRTYYVWVCSSCAFAMEIDLLKYVAFNTNDVPDELLDRDVEPTAMKSIKKTGQSTLRLNIFMKASRLLRIRTDYNYTSLESNPLPENEDEPVDLHAEISTSLTEPHARALQIRVPSDNPCMKSLRMASTPFNTDPPPKPLLERISSLDTCAIARQNSTLSPSFVNESFQQTPVVTPYAPETPVQVWTAPPEQYTVLCVPALGSPKLLSHDDLLEACDNSYNNDYSLPLSTFQITSAHSGSNGAIDGSDYHINDGGRSELTFGRPIVQLFSNNKAEYNGIYESSELQPSYSSLSKSEESSTRVNQLRVTTFMGSNARSLGCAPNASVTPLAKPQLSTWVPSKHILMLIQLGIQEITTEKSIEKADLLCNRIEACISLLDGDASGSILSPIPPALRPQRTTQTRLRSESAIPKEFCESTHPPTADLEGRVDRQSSFGSMTNASSSTDALLLSTLIRSRPQRPMHWSDIQPLVHIDESQISDHDKSELEAQRIRLRFLVRAWKAESEASIVPFS